ncbi:TPA: hypothetical protein ACS727_000109 [Providencia alcalifaciens]|uniref:hypothetical protein n=1 Tax=Providencia alcalifaciens TaxID=126385 RepID=UPI001CC44F65|nr:hypothetical protein NVI2019_NGLDDFDA_01351 [Providencia alcalifaciens]
MNNLFPENYYCIQAEIDEMLGHVDYLPPEERSRSRLLRVRKGLIHLLCEVLPPIDNPKKQELYYWLERIATLIGIEVLEVQEKSEVKRV